MDDRENGHVDGEGLLPEEARARLRAARAQRHAEASSSLRAGEQMARLEERIRAFHRSLDALDGAETSVEGLSRRAADLTGTANGTTNGNAEHGAPPPSAPDPAPVPSRRIDALRPDSRSAESRPPDALPRAEQIQAEAEQRAEAMRARAEAEAAEIRASAEAEMSHLWSALEREVEAIQAAISQRVDRLSARMESVSAEAEEIRNRARAEAETIRQRALADAQELLAVAESEAERLILDARREADRVRRSAERATPPPPPPPADRSTAERLAEQIREATAAVTRRVSRAGEEFEDVIRPTRDGFVPDAIREVIDGLSAAITLIERSLTGLSDLIGETLGGTERD